jgi:succinoglycan biosynthesis transport protein ExoP
MDEFTGKISQGALPGKPRKMLRILDFLRRRMLLVLGAGGILFVLAFPVLLFLGKPYYETSGRVMIIRKMPQILSSGDNRSVSSYFTDYARTQVERIKHRSILLAALERLDPAQKDAIVQPGLPTNTIVDILSRRLEVEFLYGTHLIEIVFQAPQSEGIASFVNAVMDVYVERVQQEQKVQDHLYVNFLTVEQERLEKEIADIEGRLTELAKETQTATFSEAYNPFNRYRELLQESMVNAHYNRLQSENQYGELQEYANEIRQLPLDALADEIVASDQSLWDMEAWTYRTLQDMRKTLDGVAKDNPDRQYIEERMQSMQEYLRESRENVVDRTERIVHEKREYNLNSRLIEAKHNYQAALETETEIGSLIEEAENMANSASRKILEGEQLQNILETKRDKLARLDSRLAELKIDTQTPSQVLIETEAVRPISPEGRNMKKLLLLCIVLSFGLIGGGTFIYDFVDSRVRSQAELADALGSSSLRAVPLYFAEREDSSFARVTLEAPASSVAVAVRSIASRLDQERIENDSRVVMFTGTERGVGTSELLLNTAHAMKHFCGKVLVIEANPQHPKLANLIDGQPITDESLLSLFRLRDLDPSKYLRHDPERGLDAFVFPNPELGETPLETAEFREVLNKLRYRYDVVFCDTPPLLHSDLAEFVARFSDITMLVTEGDWSVYKDLRNSLQLCARLNVPAIAGILNWGGHTGKKLNMRWVPTAPWPYAKRRKHEYVPKFVWERYIQSENDAV